MKNVFSPILYCGIEIKAQKVNIHHLETSAIDLVCIFPSIQESSYTN